MNIGLFEIIWLICLSFACIKGLLTLTVRGNFVDKLMLGSLGILIPLWLFIGGMLLSAHN